MTKFAFYPPEVAARWERFAAEFAFEQTDPTPWTPLHREVRLCKAALVTTAGLRLKTQHEFRPDHDAGCADFRELSCFANRDDFAFDATGFDPREAGQDLNVLAPVDRLKELVDEGALAGMTESFASFYNVCRDLAGLKRSASALGQKLRMSYEADLCFVIAADAASNETASHVSRELERAGLSTVTLVTIREIPAQIRVPRPLFINFPFGRTLGGAGDAPLQRSILGEMIRALKTHDRPARMTDLPYTWQGTTE